MTVPLLGGHLHCVVTCCFTLPACLKNIQPCTCSAQILHSAEECAGDQLCEAQLVLAMSRSALQHAVLHCVALCYAALHCVALRYAVLRCQSAVMQASDTCYAVLRYWSVLMWTGNTCFAMLCCHTAVLNAVMWTGDIVLAASVAIPEEMEMAEILEHLTISMQGLSQDLKHAIPGEPKCFPHLAFRRVESKLKMPQGDLCVRSFCSPVMLVVENDLSESSTQSFSSSGMLDLE